MECYPRLRYRTKDGKHRRVISSKPLGLALVDDTDPAVIDTLLAGGSPQIASVLQALLALALGQAAAAVKAAAPVVKLNNIRDLATGLSAATRAKVSNVAGQGA